MLMLDVAGSKGEFVYLVGTQRMQRTVNQKQKQRSSKRQRKGETRDFNK